VKKVIWCLLALCVLFSLASCNKKQQRDRPVVIYEISEEDKAAARNVILENTFLTFTFVPATGAITVRDKRSGAEWHSNPPDLARDQIIDVVTKQTADSQFTLQYANVSGVGETLYSDLHSIQRNAYEYEVTGSGLEVRYTIGNLDRVYIVPPALEEERMIPFLDKMEDSDRSMTESSYRLYDINRLLYTDDKNALLARYPLLAEKKLYVLRDSTQNYVREEMEGFFAEAGYTRAEYFEDMEMYPSTDEKVVPAFTVTLRYSLDGKSLVVDVPFDQIDYRQAYPIIRFDLLPFFGAGGLNDQGYLFVPDGSGALIYFNNGRQNQIESDNPVYGWDEAMPREAIVIDNKAPYTAFGIQKNGSALLGVIEEGAAYAKVFADVSRRNSSYNRVYPYFEMIHGAVLDISGRSDRSVYLYEAGLPQNEKITLRYTLCEQDGYVGMAKEYRSWLTGKYPSLSRMQDGSVPVAVEVVGAINKTQHRLGIPFDLPLKLTSYHDTERMIEDFANYGWKNVSVKLTGWFNRSVEHTVPTKVKLIKELGSKGHFKKIVSAAEKNNYDLYPEVDFMYMRDLKRGDGFSLYRDAARYTNRERVEKYPYSFVWFGERTRWGKLNYLSRPSSSMKIMDKFFAKARPLGLKNIAFRNMGSKLAGDYHEKRHVSREASMRMRQDKFASLFDQDKKIMVSRGYEYSVPWASFVIDMEIDDQGFGITDTAVPFYQIALHGLVPYTSKAINLAEDYTNNLLKAVEAGAGLYFSFMKEETVLLQETKFRQFYANEYDKWIGDANDLYKKFSADFNGLFNQAIVNHEILTHGITVTEYENGTRVAVNRTNNDWNYNGRIIYANNYTVLRRGE
jgi:hypothetical protein